MKQSESVTLVYRFTIVVILAVVVLAFGWITLVPGDDADKVMAAQIEAINAKQEIWEQQRPQSFRYVVRRRCFCGQDWITPYQMTEEKGYRTVEYVGAIESGYTGTGPDQPMSIDDLFEVARQAVLEEADVTMSFDEQFGFPNQIVVDRDCVDCNDAYSVYKFEQI